MISRNLFFPCCMLVVLLSISPEARSQHNPPCYCQDTTYNPNGNSTYRANLDFLLSSLTNASRNHDFYNISTARLNTSDVIYGLFMCRGDVTGEACQQCVENAAREIRGRCPDQKVAIIWYENCLLRYENGSIFSVGDRSIKHFRCNPERVKEVDRFNHILKNLMDETATKAANRGSGKKFAVKERYFSSFQKGMYTLAECIPYLSDEDCKTCLRDAIADMASSCNGRQGARVLFPNCGMRYEPYRFYNSAKGKKHFSRLEAFAIVLLNIILIVLLVTAFFLQRKRSKRRYHAKDVATDGIELSTKESIQYNLSQIQSATNNFSIEQKIGQGGFGSVHKGMLPNGQDIAVKRLSRSSLQGAEEFKNEITLLAKLQHRNLVRLLGFCFQREEKILVYEFVPNKSLDYFIFDSEKQLLLDWPRRYKIIRGIGKGLLYLHEDSHLRIIHRDLKASNILLDANMNPKIADFGMARIFGVDQHEGNTNRIAGTFGYMAPEYAMHGQFSVKSDVFSFGVLVLEIISGKKNSSFYQSDCAQDLLNYAWKRWSDGTPLALVDPALGNSYARNEVIQCIHLGLQCVQEDVEQRPSMASVVSVLKNNSVNLATPQQPPSFVRCRTKTMPVSKYFDTSTSNFISRSTNGVSITEPYPR